MSNVQILIDDEKRIISKTGGTAAIYMPKELKEFLGIGDSVKITAKIEENQIVMIVSKPLFNFGLNEIKKLLDNNDFKIKKEETVGDVNIFQANKKDVFFSYTKNLFEKISPSYITVKKIYSNLEFKKYNEIIKKTKKLKEQFDVIVRPEGDLDTVKILREPESYKINVEETFTLLKQADKKIGFSIVIRLNNKKNSIDELKSVIEMLNSNFSQQSISK